MIQQLRQITNSFLNSQPTLVSAKQNYSAPAASIYELITLNVYSIDFKECIPSTIHERKLTITLKQNHLDPKIIRMAIVCQDQRLNELPEYIFGVRKDNTSEYFDEFRFKAMQKGTYNFVLGVKTPGFVDYQVQAKLLISIEGIPDYMQIPLKQTTVLPFVSCCKELVSDQGFRMIKLAVIKSKAKKETKIAFKCSENINFTLLSEVIGVNEQPSSEIQVRPKTICTGGKGLFVLTFITNFPADFGEEKVCVRKVLTLQIKQTSCFFHFPIEVIFYPESRQSSLIE